MDVPQAKVKETIDEEELKMVSEELTGRKHIIN